MLDQNTFIAVSYTHLVAFIVTKNGKRICDVIDECSQRGSTILKAQGGYKQDDIQAVSYTHLWSAARLCTFFLCKT